ncbi:MAG: VOC family protein [Blastocatellia bacterium]
MIKIREIDHVVLRVTELEAMLHFYCDALGCVIERSQEELGLTQLRAGRSLIDFAQNAAPNGEQQDGLRKAPFRIGFVVYQTVSAYKLYCTSFF